MCSFPERLFHIHTEEEFASLSLEIFRFQYEKNDLYHEYCKHLGVTPMKVDAIHKIPFLPVSFFKTHEVKTTSFVPEKIFTSSSTTGTIPARHLIKDLSLYEKSFTESFRYFYGDPSEYAFLALLPGYLEREGSSLVYMLDAFIKNSKSPESDFYLRNHEKLYNTLMQLHDKNRKTILFGVTFALLDFAERYAFDFPELIVFETGGMKGRRKEMVKEELHALLQKAFGVNRIHSEYGMCELLSQAYSRGENIFQTPPWMRILLQDEKDPFSVSERLESGVINVIDLANIYSISFIATDDLGKRNHSGVEVLGRLDNAEIRGCNLLIF